MEHSQHACCRLLSCRTADCLCFCQAAYFVVPHAFTLQKSISQWPPPNMGGSPSKLLSEACTKQWQHRGRRCTAAGLLHVAVPHGAQLIPPCLSVPEMCPSSARLCPGSVLTPAGTCAPHHVLVVARDQIACNHRKQQKLIASCRMSYDSENSLVERPVPNAA